MGGKVPKATEGKVVMSEGVSWVVSKGKRAGDGDGDARGRRRVRVRRGRCIVGWLLGMWCLIIRGTRTRVRPEFLTSN